MATLRQGAILPQERAELGEDTRACENSRDYVSSVMQYFHNKSFFLGCSLALLLLSGCATPYQASGTMGGFTETQVAENAFEVSFGGNGYTKRERATDFCLLRCAELAHENGFTHFVIVDGSEGSNTSYHTSTNSFGATTTPITKPSTRNTILCFREEPEINGLVYEAKFVLNSIRNKYGITVQ